MSRPAPSSPATRPATEAASRPKMPPRTSSHWRAASASCRAIRSVMSGCGSSPRPAVPRPRCCCRPSTERARGGHRDDDQRPNATSQRSPGAGTQPAPRRARCSGECKGPSPALSGALWCAGGSGTSRQGRVRDTGAGHTARPCTVPSGRTSRTSDSRHGRWLPLQYLGKPMRAWGAGRGGAPLALVLAPPGGTASALVGAAHAVQGASAPGQWQP